MQTISVLVEGRKCYLKVTKGTTCGDVIHSMLNYNGLKENDQDPYFLISESNRVHFIMRKKTRIFMPKISIAKHIRLREKSSTKEQKVSIVPSTLFDSSTYTPVRKASEQIRGVKRLYELVQVQKRRLSEVYQKSNDTAKFFKQTITKKTFHSKADTSLDQFLQNVNKENMHGFLNFCDMVATKKMENLSSALPTSASVMECHMRTILNTLQSPLLDYIAENPLVKETSLYQRFKSELSFGRMTLPSSRRLSIADPSRIRWNEEPLHSTPLANKAMSYLNKSSKPTRMKRQFGSSRRFPLDLLPNLTETEIPICDSSFNRRPDGDLSMSISQRKSASSSPNDKCKYFREHCIGSDSDDSLDWTLQDKELNDAVLSTVDDNMMSLKLANDRDHLMLIVDRSPCAFPHVHDVLEDARDDSMKANFKMRLVNYSFIDFDISTLSCGSVGMSCDCKKTPCATFTRDYVTRFGYAPESA
ncbi:hypothetical protein ACJMK2_020691 [Sinanodonta woodiana]|uniref:Uncharacterized protein n=1 Tax=Sinanodonta woodiana TaxID=1069815 RepID=A0ABD3U3A9_SINWO